MDHMALFTRMLAEESRAVTEEEPVVNTSQSPGETEQLIKSALQDVDRVTCLVRFRRWPVARRGFVERAGAEYRFVYYGDNDDECEQIRIFSPGYYPYELGALVFK